MYTGYEMQIAHDDAGNASHARVYPDMVADACVELQLSSSIIGDWLECEPTGNLSHVIDCPLRVSTYNAQSLAGDGGPQCVAAQACSRKVHILGLQETRSKLHGIKKLGVFLRVFAPASNGNHGCEIWFDTCIPFCHDHDRPVHINRDNITIMHHDPRRLIVVVQTCGQIFGCASLHGPHAGCKEPLCQWWRETARLCTLHVPRIPLLSLMDSNLASPNCSLLRDKGLVSQSLFLNPKQESFDGSFRDWLCVCEQTAFGSFEEYRKFDGLFCNRSYVTRCRGRPEIIDHIMGRGFVCKHGTYRTVYDHVHLNEGDDHFPIECIVTWSSPASSNSIRRRRLPYDRSKIGTPEADACFCQCLALCPDVPYQVEPTSHAWIIQKCILNAAMIAYPRSGTKAHQSYITESTLSQIQSCKKNYRALQSGFSH